MGQQKLGGVALLLPGQRRSAQQRGEDAAAQAKHVAALDAIEAYGGGKVDAIHAEGGGECAEIFEQAVDHVELAFHFGEDQHTDQ